MWVVVFDTRSFSVETGRTTWPDQVVFWINGADLRHSGPAARCTPKASSPMTGATVRDRDSRAVARRRRPASYLVRRLSRLARRPPSRTAPAPPPSPAPACHRVRGSAPAAYRLTRPAAVDLLQPDVDPEGRAREPERDHCIAFVSRQPCWPHYRARSCCPAGKTPGTKPMPQAATARPRGCPVGRPRARVALLGNWRARVSY